MRRQLESVREQSQQRLRELTGRLEQLESQRRVATPAPGLDPRGPRPQSAPSSAEPGHHHHRVGAGRASQPVSPTIGGSVAPRQPFALAQPGRTLLFDIGVSGDFVTDFTSRTRERRQDGTFSGRENRFFPREVELGLFGRVDPYASAVVRLSAGEEPAGLEPSDRSLTVKVDELTSLLLTLPLGHNHEARAPCAPPSARSTWCTRTTCRRSTARTCSRFFGEEQMDGEKGVAAFWVSRCRSTTSCPSASSTATTRWPSAAAACATRS